MLLTTGEVMKGIDSTAINILGIPSELLMENAAHAIADAAEELATSSSAAVFCGTGNNGGDGIAAARFLIEKGFRVRTYLVGDPARMSPDSREMLYRLRRSGGDIELYEQFERVRNYTCKCGVIVDAIFGFGLSRPVSGPALAAIELINSSGVPVVSADVPSGVNISTGEIMGDAVKADRTVTFTMAKPGLFSDPGSSMCGRVTVADIGIPSKALSDIPKNTHAIIPGERLLPERPEISHKGSFGKLLIIGGCEGYTGAPTLCAKAAVRSGAGLVWLGVPRDIYPITAIKNDEAMPFAITDTNDLLKRSEGCTVSAIGPGLGRSVNAIGSCLEFIEKCGTPLVADADALFALSTDMSVLKRRSSATILTPHDAEFMRMGGKLSGDRVSDARRFAANHGCILVLKGHRTIIAFPDGEVYINTTGNPGMAKGGSGDVLTGIIAAMTAQFGVKDGVLTGVYLHGLSGDLCRGKLGEYSLTPSDIIAHLPQATMAIGATKP